MRSVLHTCIIYTYIYVWRTQQAFIQAQTTRAFFKTVLGNLEKFEEEQRTTNYLLRTLHLYPTIQIRWGLLPREYWTYGEIAGQFDGFGGLKGHWINTDENFDIPDNIIIHHGNWTRTKDDKYKILDIVRRRVNGN